MSLGAQRRLPKLLPDRSIGFISLVFIGSVDSVNCCPIKGRFSSPVAYGDEETLVVCKRRAVLTD
jgi:hypothetical protein